MDRQAWVEALAQDAKDMATLDALGGKQVVVAWPGDGPVAYAKALLEAAKPFVLVARSLPSAVRIRQALAPQEADLLARAAQDETAPAKVRLFRSHEKPSTRLSLLNAQKKGQLLGVIVTPEDLEPALAIGELCQEGAEDLIWLVEDAHRMSVLSADHNADLAALHRIEGAKAQLYFTDIRSPDLIQHLGESLGLSPEGLHVGGGLSTAPVAIQIDLGTHPTTEREALHGVLAKYLPGNGAGRAVVVAPLHGAEQEEGLSTSEIISVGEELGVHALIDPGEDADAKASQWLNIHQKDAVFLLTDDAEAMSILPEGSQPVMMRLMTPAGPEVLLQEILSLSKRGGGSWVYAGDPTPAAGDCLDLDALMAGLAAFLEGLSGSQSVSIEVGQLAKSWGLSAGSRSAKAFHQQLAQAFVRLGELGLFGATRFVRLDLKVADASRFKRPFVDVDPRFVALWERYQGVLGEMSLADSIRFRLESREPHDLRDWARLLGYDAHVLNNLFDDLAREGVIVARQVVKGGSDEVNLELTPKGTWEASRESLSQVFDALKDWRAQAAKRRQAVAEALQADDILAKLGEVISGGLGSIALPDVQVIQHRPVVPQADKAALSTDFLQSDGAISKDGAGDPLPEVAPAPAQNAALEALKARDAAGDAFEGSIAFDAFLALTQNAIQLDALGDGLHAQVAAIFWQVFDGDGDSAVEKMGQLLAAHPNLPQGECVARVEYLIRNGDDQPVGALDARLLTAALSLPLIEGLDGEQAQAQLANLIDGGDIEPGSFGSGAVNLEGARYILERRGAAPEIEAQLWLQVQGDGEILSTALKNARLAEYYLAIAGMGEDELSLQLAEYLVQSDGSVSPVMLAERWAFARAQALLECGKTKEAVDAMAVAEPPQGMAGEYCQVLARLSVEIGQIHQALDWALGREAAHGGTFAKMVSAVQSEVADQSGDQSFESLTTGYAVDKAHLPYFLAENPFSESKESLMGRAIAGADEGWSPADIHALIGVVERLGWGWPEGLVASWIPGTEGDESRAWMHLGKIAMDNDQNDIAKAVLARPDLEGADGLDELTGRMAIIDEKWAEALQATLAWPAHRAVSFFNHFAAETFLPALQTLKGTVEDGADLLERIALLEGEVEKEGQRKVAADALQGAIDVRNWTEMVEKSKAYATLMGERSDGLLKHAQRRLRERGEYLLKKARGLRRIPLERLRSEDLERLKADGVVFEIPEIVEKADEALTALSNLASERQAADAARQEKAAQNRGAERQTPPRRNNERAARRPARKERGGSPSDAVLKGPIAEVETRLREALKGVNNDRERMHLLMDGFRFMCKKKQSEGAIKVLRDQLDAFERVQSLDGPLARMVEKGVPADEHLPRLRRILDKVSGRFRYTLEAIGARDNPEPWKQILGQLKLKA